MFLTFSKDWTVAPQPLYPLDKGVTKYFILLRTVVINNNKTRQSDFHWLYEDFITLPPLKITEEKERPHLKAPPQ